MIGAVFSLHFQDFHFSPQKYGACDRSAVSQLLDQIEGRGTRRFEEEKKSVKKFFSQRSTTKSYSFWVNFAAKICVYVTKSANFSLFQNFTRCFIKINPNFGGQGWVLQHPLKALVHMKNHVQYEINGCLFLCSVMKNLKSRDSGIWRERFSCNLKVFKGLSPTIKHDNVMCATWPPISTSSGFI